MRAPFQVLVIPYRKTKDYIEYCVFNRSDSNYFQFIAGGGEADETPMEAAIRESYEEANLENSLNYKRLTSTFYVPADCINESHRKNWSIDTIVLPEYCFYVDVKNTDIKISKEHTNFKWLSYEKAKDLLFWQTNKVALYELKNRIELCIE